MTEKGSQHQLEKRNYNVVLFYKYAYLADPLKFIDFVGTLCRRSDDIQILGRILVAEEGINGTLSAFQRVHLDYVIQQIAFKYPQFSNVDWKFSNGKGLQLPFGDLHLRHVKQLIGGGLKGKLVDEMISFDECTIGGLSETCTGKHLSPREFHDSLISSHQEEEPIVIDVRNKFEYEIGHFRQAMTLDTNTYSESYDSLQQMLVNDLKADKKRPIYMYCTGGIRCEKASAFVKSKGFENVYQLAGGIHRYLDDIDAQESLFVGKNFVFDGRMSLYKQNNDVNPSSCHPINTKLRHGDCVDEGEAAETRPDGNNENIVVVGKCIECNIPHDALSGLIICTVCRTPVLVCSSCVVELVEFHCERHQHLKHIYFSILKRFTTNELELQCGKLKDMESMLLTLGRGAKNKRRTIRRQIEKIEKTIVNRRVKMSESSDIKDDLMLFECDPETATTNVYIGDGYNNDTDSKTTNLALTLQNPKTLVHKRGFFWTS